MTPFYKIESSVMDEMVKMDGELRSEIEFLRSALRIIAAPGDSHCDGCALIAEVALAHHPTPQAGEQEQP